jgi:hypothetical protein
MKSIEYYKLTYALNDNDALKAKAKNEEEKIIYSLIDEFANDKNSSKFREDVTKLMVGKQPSNSKLGYDDDTDPIEVKPANFTGEGNKLNGKGNFSDFTWSRHKKYLNDKVIMLVSGFYKGKLLFIIEFSYDALTDKVEERLNKKLPNGDQKGIYVRSLNFTYKNWQNSTFVIKYMHPDINNFKHCFSKNFYGLLKKHKQNINALQWLSYD